MNRFRIVADSSCDLLTLDGADFVSVPLTIRTDTEEFRDDAFLDVERDGHVYCAAPGGVLTVHVRISPIGKMPSVSVAM